MSKAVSDFGRRKISTIVVRESSSGGWREFELSYKGHMMDALVPAGDEGRDKLR